MVSNTRIFRNSWKKKLLRHQSIMYKNLSTICEREYSFKADATRTVAGNRHSKALASVIHFVFVVGYNHHKHPLLNSLLSNLWECNFVTFAFCCPHSLKSHTAMHHFWMILIGQPVDNSSFIWSSPCFTRTDLKSTCTYWLNPHTRRRVNTWKLFTVAYWHVHLNLTGI